MTEELKDEGWYLTEEGLEICKDGLDKVTTAALIKKALDTDLREIGGPFLSDEIYKDKTDHISGPCVLQIQKLKNVSSPKYATSNSSPPLLRMIVTDGHIYVSCLQWGQWKNITLDTPPGTKLYVKPMKVQVQNGFLLLSERQFTVLGGHVSAMVEKWELGKSLASHVRRGEGTEDGPPPWIPFGKSINYKDTKVVSGNFKSLEQEAKEEKEHTIFKQQRMANIAEVSKAKEGKVKVFGGGKDKQSNSNNSFDPPHKSYSRDYGSSFSRKDITKNYFDSGVQNPVQKIEGTAQNSSPGRATEKSFGSQRYEREPGKTQPPRTDNFKRPETEKFNKKYDNRTRYDEQKPSYVKNESSDYRSNARNGYQSQNTRPDYSSSSSMRNDYPALNMRNDYPPPNMRNDFPSPNMRNDYSSPNVRNDHSAPNMRNDYSSSNMRNDYSSPNMRNNYPPPNMRNEFSSPNLRNSANRRDFDARTRNENDRNDRPIPSFVKPGADVMAKYWEDKRFYHAKIHAVGENGTCVVHFVEYGNYEEIRVNDIRPFSPNWNADSNNASNANNEHGMHFTGVLEFRRGGSKPYVHRNANGDFNQDQHQPRDNRMQRNDQRPAARLYQPPRLRKLQ